MTKSATQPVGRSVVCFLSKQSPARYKDLDAEILERHFEVIRINYSYKLSSLIAFLREVRRADVLVSWFANPWLGVMRFFIPRKVKIIVIAGGYDVADSLKLNYGSRYNWSIKWITRRLLERADLVLAVSKFNQSELLGWVHPRRQELLYNAVDFPNFEPLLNVVRDRKVITVGAIESFISKRKGHYRFIQVAKLLPEVEFVIIGKGLDHTFEELQSLAPPNVRFLGYVTREQLLQEMLSASVYLQLSVHEAFGVSVAEAVACGCYPVVAADTALPEVIGAHGSIVEGEDLEAAATEVSKALEQKSYRTVDYRSVRNLFSVEQREAGLLRAVEGVLSE